MIPHLPYGVCGIARVQRIAQQQPTVRGPPTYWLRLVSGLPILGEKEADFA